MNLRGRYRAIIFDLDGVVIDSEPQHQKATLQVLESSGLVVPEAAYATFKGLPDRETFELAVRTYGTPNRDISSMMATKQDLYHTLFDELAPVAGAVELIRLAASTFDLALTTSSEPEDASRALERFGLGTYFSVVITAADVDLPKPDPQPYRLTVECLGRKSTECLVIEDSLNGIRSAVAAGCDVAGLTTSFEPALLREAGATVVADHLDDLARLLGLG